MGGLTTIYLKNTSEKNIKKQNELLKLHNVSKKYRFESEEDTIFEYEGFVKGKGHFPEHLFPKDKINSLSDFKKYWNHKALGQVFVAQIGSFNFDCYFGRTSKRAMNNISKYLEENVEEIKSVSGSFSTFVERGMTKKGIKLMEEHKLL